MPILEVEEQKTIQREHKNKFLPTITKWKGNGAKEPVNIIRQESFFAAVDEVINWAEEIDVTRVGIVGDMHSGKSTMAEAIAHRIHDKSVLGFRIKKLVESDLMNFEETLKQLEPANYILIFDDVSFLDAKHNKKAISQVKEAVTKIRHLEGGKDVKIVLIYNYHYTKGLDKYLRQADFRFFTTVGSEEDGNMEGIVGTKMMGLVQFFAKARQEGVTKKFFTSPARLPNKKRFVYKWRDPFIPALFYNNRSIRFIISPTRQWLQPICSVCSAGTSGVTSEISVEQFIKESEAKFPGTFKNVVKQFLKEQGVDTYSRNTIAARRYLDRALEKKLMRLEDLAISYGLTQKRTKLRKKLDGVLE